MSDELTNDRNYSRDSGLGFVVAKAYSLPFAMQIAMCASITA